MKILIVRPTPNKMNLNSYNLQEIGLAKALIRKGHECDVMYYCGKEKDHNEIITFDGGLKLKILWLHGYSIFKEGIYPSLNKYVNDYDIIQVGGHEGITSCWLNRKYQNKVVNYQGPYYCKYNKGDNIKAALLDKTLLMLSNKKYMIVGTKSKLATDYIKSKKINNVTTIGVGLDLSNIIDANKENIYKNEFLNKIVSQKNGPYLLYIGKLEPRRNIPFIFDTLKKVVEKIPHCKLIMIGKGKEKYVKYCMKYMQKLGLENNFIYCKSLEQKYIKNVYECSDAFLLPTRYEIFGMVILEAMYFKVPVFTTYNGGASTLINKENGVIIDELESRLWSSKICEILQDEQKKKKLGYNANKTIVLEYTWDILSEKFLELYKKRLNMKE